MSLVEEKVAENVRRPHAPTNRVDRQRLLLPRPLIQLLVIVLAGIVWWIVSILMPAGTIPSPIDTLITFVGLTVTGPFWAAIGITLLGFIAALLMSVLVGVPLGLLVGSSTFASQSSRLVLDFVRTIPPIALLPLFLLLFGARTQMVIVLAIAGAIWPILIQSIYAARQGESMLVDMARTFKVPRAWFIWHIFLPGASPFIMTGLRVGTTICLLLTITGELLGGAPGIGSEIANAQAYYDIPRMYAYVLLSALLGLIVNGAFWAAQRRMLHWHASFRKESAR